MTHSSSQFISGGALTNPTVGSSGGFGVKWFGTNLLDIVPLTKNAAAFAASQSPGTSALTLTAGTGVTRTTVSGNTVYQADVARVVTITSGGNDSGITFTITGYDFYNAPMTQKLTGSNGGTATTTKAFYSILSIVPSAAVASTATAGTGDIFGLPVQLIDKGYVDMQNWANTTAIDGGTCTVADQTTPATNLTGDVRGTYAPSSASNGSRRLVFAIQLNATQLANNPAVANATAILGVTQA